MIKNKKQMFIIIGVFLFLVILGGTTYAWFNYKREGGEHTLIAGNIYLTLTEGDDSINLGNIFPETKEEARARNDNYLTFEITGINESNKTVYYEIDLNHGTDKESPYERFLDKDLRFDLVELDSNGDEVKYLLSEASFDTLVNKKIWVDTIDASSSTEINRKYKLRMWLSDEVLISDSDSNRDYYATGYNNHYANIKISVIGDFNEKLFALQKVKKNVITPANPINYANISSDSNGKGLYILPGTENDDYPIMYYRGAINNNNVIFGGYCWQMVRTTDTGGIKMIYNGEPTIEGSGENITYNCGTTRPLQNSITTTISLSITNGYYYADDYEIVSTSGNGATYRLKSKNNPITKVPIASTADAASNIPTIIANYPYTCKLETASGTCTVLYKVDSYAYGSYANAYVSTDISTIGNNAFNSNYNSVSDVGYMSGTRYVRLEAAPTSGAYFGTSVEYGEYDTNNPGTNVYRLVDDGNGSVGTTLDEEHHYTCNQTTANGICTQVRYYFNVSGSYYYYIILKNGETVEDALYKMTGNGSSATKQKNSSYILNQNDSTIKTAIENWYRTNLTNEVDTGKRNYTVYLEDTVYCNDRSYKTEAGSITTFQESGWNPNGGNLASYLYFGSSNRIFNNWYSASNVPSIVCPNETDRFSVGSSVAHLNYPVGLLTVDEMIMAGASGSASISNQSYYLYTGDYFWSMSPKSFTDPGAAESVISTPGDLSSQLVIFSHGIRPVVSLKLGVEFETGGDGTPTNPYVVKY